MSASSGDKAEAGQFPFSPSKREDSATVTAAADPSAASSDKLIVAVSQRPELKRSSFSNHLVQAGYPVAIALRGVVQHYAWGKCKETSLVAAMATEQVRSQRGPMRAPPLSRGNRFAELWMGTHPNGPSSVILPGSGPRSGEGAEPEEHYLKDTIELDPDYWLGVEDADRKDLPYLFKVLAVRQALSIQAHPNKRLAEQLHKKFPAHYPDGNHKPEICIPLGHFEALCGFRPLAEINQYLEDVPELQELCAGGACSSSSRQRHCDVIEEEDEEGLEKDKEKIKSPSSVIRKWYTNLMRADPFLVRQKVATLIQRLASKEHKSPEEELILRTEQDYKGDVGIFSIYFLNYVRITPEMPNQFIYCAPDEPHAYLLGDAVECMAISDNVVRAGLTSKHKDVDTLLQMMSYRDDLLPELVRSGERVAEHIVKYDPPVDDFTVYEIDGPVTEGFRFPHAAIIACISGSFQVQFRPPPGHIGGSEVVDAVQARSQVRAKGPVDVKLGNTFFSMAGAELVVLSASEASKLFIATY